ncbi:hypothetical protein [Actinomadura sp. RB99]|uniref:hypothetical protein n=1 Tax=Actinomadura sp. RB99 TaxID=2691577 RepID=UPI00168A1468|nr:hypothetical protein [Actinomadura sp. RB99]
MMYAEFCRSTSLIVRYEVAWTPATSSSGMSTGPAAVATSPLRIIESDRRRHRSAPNGGAAGPG